MKYLMLILFMVCSVDCRGNDPKPTPVVTDTQWCPAAEQQLLVSCPAVAQPNKYMKDHGETFKDFCKRKQEEGIFLNPRCLSIAKDCIEVNACTGSEK